MRITSNAFPSHLTDQLSLLGARQAQLQEQAASGQRIQSAEDDPGAMQRVLGMQTEQAGIAQFRRNISSATERATATFEVMRGLKKISDRVSEIATLADGARSPEELKTYGTEVSQLLRQAIQIANGKHRGDFLLGGTRADQVPFVSTSDADGNITEVTYNGNTEVAPIEIAEGSFETAQVPGANITGSGPRGLLADTRTGADFFGHLIALRDHLLKGDTAAVADADRAALTRDEDNLVYQMGSNGAIQSRLDAAESLAGSRAQSLDGLVSNETDVDLAETLVKLNQVQTAYRAALQSGATVMDRSLLDFIR